MPINQRKLDDLRAYMKTWSTTDLVRMTDTLRDAFEKKIAEHERAIIQHERFGRIERVKQNEEWRTDNERYLKMAQLLHDVAVEMSAEEFATAFWASRRRKS